MKNFNKDGYIMANKDEFKALLFDVVTALCDEDAQCAVTYLYFADRLMQALEGDNGNNDRD